MGHTHDPSSGKEMEIPYIVTDIPDRLGRNAIQALQISVDKALRMKAIHSSDKKEDVVRASPASNSQPDASLQRACHELCDEVHDLFKPELGCLKNFELEVKFKPDAEPVFCKPRPVPFAVRDDLAKAYKQGIPRGV